LALSLGGARLAAAQAQPPPEPTPPAVEAPPPPPPTPPAVEPPMAPSPTPPAVQTFEPADVTGPKAGEGGPVSTEPAKTVPGTHPLTMDEMPVAAANNRVTLNMFGDTAFVVDNVPIPDKSRGFLIGDLDLLITGRAANLTALAEAALEQRGGGEIGIDLERIFVGWRGERVSVDAGRTHVELGYWNNAFHHGRWLQITAERPRILKFEDEGGILPIHFIGTTAHWRAYLSGDQQIELVGGIGNGRGDFTKDVQETAETNWFKAVQARLGFKGFGARDLQFGVSGLVDRIAGRPGADPMMTGVFIRPALPDQNIGEVIGNAYLAYRGVQLTIISEAFDILHSAAMPDVNGASHWNTFDAYALGAYRIGDFSPYVMAEIRRTSSDDDPFYFPGNPAIADITANIFRNFEELTAGVRWDLTTWSAIKVEYRGTFQQDLPHIHAGTIDWSFGL
jgi:hypothetical protein